MAQFIAKIVTWFANEHLVKFLARNKTFQQTAVKIDSFLSGHKETVQKTGEEYLKRGGTIFKEEAAKVHQAATSKSGFDFVKFVTAFKNEIMKDISKLNDTVTKK